MRKPRAKSLSLYAYGDYRNGLPSERGSKGAGGNGGVNGGVWGAVEWGLGKIEVGNTG